nr:DUF6602 domain-containing protein [uncultured Porphyromonas sp.]
MKYYQAESNLYIEIRASVFQQIQRQSECEYPNENGGMLAGYYSEDRRTVHIEGLVAPAQKLSSRTAFTRIPEGLEAEWERLGEKGMYYIGEWHSHPDGTTKYSSTDLRAMIEIEKEVNIGNPILLIVGIKHGTLHNHTFYYYKRGDLLTFKKMVDLRDLFHGLQAQMLTRLNVNREVISHPGSKGDATEQHWIDFLRTYLPNRYKVDKAMIIDSTGDVSEQIDLVIYDAIYTPFIFKQDGFMYIPAEGVYAVFEVKQDIKENIKYAARKVESVRQLKRTSIGMIASGRFQPPAPLTKIIGGILTTTSSYSNRDTIERNIKQLSGYQTLDIGCICDQGCFYVSYEGEYASETNSEDNNGIEDIYRDRKVEGIQFSDRDTSLFSFFFQLVSSLKRIGTVPAIDINAYLQAAGVQIEP